MAIRRGSPSINKYNSGTPFFLFEADSEDSCEDHLYELAAVDGSNGMWNDSKELREDFMRTCIQSFLYYDKNRTRVLSIVELAQKKNVSHQVIEHLKVGGPAFAARM